MSDAKGYYARLGVSATATGAEIKSAFRRLAKQTHPDQAGQNSNGDRFRLLVEAYEVLSNPASRARYDGLHAPPRGRGPDKQARFEPIHCKACNQIAAQPRYLVFRNVVSFILVTTRNPVQGIYCSTCAKEVALKSTAFSAIAGWWGFPWGPIFTIFEGLRNAAGGEVIQENQDRLLLHNAIAFMQRGDWKLSLALAQRIESSSDPDISNDAKRLINVLKSRGVNDAAGLKDPWSFNFLHFVAHILLIAAVPTLIAVLVTTSTPSQTTVAPPPPFDPSPIINRAEPISNADVSASEPILAVCTNLPTSGQRLAGRRLSGDGHAVEIENGADGDAIIKIRNADTGRLVTSFFVAQSTTAGVRGLPDGRYTIQYAFGPSLAANCRSFTSISSASEFPDAGTLVTEERQEALGVRIIRHRLRYTLFSVPDGNIQPIPLDPSAFERN